MLRPKKQVTDPKAINQVYSLHRATLPSNLLAMASNLLAIKTNKVYDLVQE